MEKFNLDLSLVARLGGHSQPRTHRGKERFPGMTITYATRSVFFFCFGSLVLFGEKRGDGFCFEGILL